MAKNVPIKVPVMVIDSPNGIQYINCSGAKVVVGY